MTFNLDWSTTNIDGSNTISSGGETVGVTISTPQNADHDQWYVQDGTLYSTDVCRDELATLNFDQDVANISFTLYDVDLIDEITIHAYDADGNLVPVTFEATGVHTVNGNSVVGTTTNNPGPGGTNPGQDIDVTIAGPIVKLVITHDDGPTHGDSGAVAVSDISFDIAAPELDGIVSGTSGDDLIDVAYTGDPEGDMIDSGDAVLPHSDDNEDIVVAGDGDDTVLAGDADDIVYGNGGSDTLIGGAGDDTLIGDASGPYGDGAGTGTSTQEVFEWSELSDKYGGTLSNGERIVSQSQDTGENVVTLTLLNDNDNTFGSNQQKVHSIDTGSLPGANAYSSLESELDSKGDCQDYTLDFEHDAENISFRVNDIDYDSTVVITAFDANGDPVEVTMTAGDGITLYDNDGVAGYETAVSNGGSGSDTSPTYSALVSIAGPLSQIVITHTQDGWHDSGMNVTDIYFDTLTAGHEGPGDDVISGGLGDDYIVGNEGDDTLTGGEGADTIFGNADADTIIGGNAGDVVDGGSAGDDNDTLDLSGSGPLRVVGQTNDADGNSTSGTVEFLDVDGNVSGSMTFTEIENLILPPNTGPSANNDTYTLDEDGSVTFNPLLNDTDPDGDTLTLNGASDPAHGTLTDNGDGTYTYTPDADYNGTDSVTYTVDDGNGGTDTATVTFTVTPVNDAPDAMNDTIITDEDTPVTIDVLDNDTDVDGDTLTLTGATVPADQGTVAIVGGELLFTPADDFNGVATISYSIEDGNGGTDTATVEVGVTPVNDDPVAVDDAVDTDEDTPVTIDLVGNDTDVDGDPLTIGTVSVDPALGTVVDNGDGTATFTPAPNYFGPATITYTVVDGAGGEDTGEAVVNVGSVNDGPTANDGSDTTDEDTPITVDLTGNDTDPDGDVLTVTGASVPADQGTLVDNGDGTVTFTPAENFFGTATISYSVTDGNGGTDSASHVITVNSVNDDPVAVDDIETTDEDQPITIDLVGNDTDVDGDPLTIGTVSVDPAFGTVVDNGDGTVTFNPALNYNGPVTITYTVVDGQGGEDTGEAVVSVGAVNDAPVANDDTATTDEDTPVTVDLIDNDTDADGDPLTVINATVPADQGTVVNNGDGTVTFIPAEHFDGEATISYEVSDGNGGTDTGTLTVTVTPVNDAPVANGDLDSTEFETPVTIDVLFNDTDPDGDPLEILGTPTSDDGTVVVNPDGTITFTPNDGFEGDAFINYEVTDGNGGTDTAVVTVVVAENDNPRDGIVQGTNGDDVIDINYTGDPHGDQVDHNDEIRAGEGPNDDIILAGAGDDLVRAGEGDDDVFGGLGNDNIYGDAGDDNLLGDAGNDNIHGGEGDDRIVGGIGDDTLTGGDGSDSVFGGDGNDTIDTSLPGFNPDLGYPGLYPADPDPLNDVDYVEGGAGNDIIFTGDDSDTIDGGTGNDFIDGGEDSDTIDGGDGDDTIIGGEGSDIIDGGDGHDTIYGGLDPSLLDVLNIPNDGSGPTGPDLVTNNGMDVIHGGDGNDTIFGADDDDTLFGDAGNDIIDGGIDDDTIDGGDGDDILIGGQGNDIIHGGSGEDTLTGGLGNDTLEGGADNDTIDGDEGADIIHGGTGEDTVTGGDGNDNITGDTGDDTLFGDAGDDTIDGGQGADIIHGGTGEDTLTGGQGIDTLEGGADNDTIDGGQGADIIHGGTGDDTVTGGDGDDNITGDAGDDILFGDAGDDMINGGTGADTMSGGDDRDTFTNINAGDVVDGGEGGDDFDTLDLTGSRPVDGTIRVIYDAGNPENGHVDFRDSNGNVVNTMDFSNIENVIPCFTPGTLIATPKGERLVEELRMGDKIITRDNGIQEIRWVGEKKMGWKDLAANPHLKPILIQKGSLGNDLPERDMMVSPNHRMLVANDKTMLYFEEREVLAAAKHLVNNSGVQTVETMGTSYLHFMFDNHEVVLSDGAWTESFQPGDYTLQGIGNAQRAEILELFPELATAEGIKDYQSARKTLKAHEARLLAK